MTILRSKKKICIITGSRSDYSLLRSIIFTIKKDKNINLKIITTGSHLEKNFGYTVKELINDGLNIDYKVKLNLKNANEKNIAFSTSLGIKKFFNIFKKIKPDGLLVLGDRYEIFSAAYAAHMLKLKIFHFAGGEKTPYVYDNAIRNCLSFFATYHFVANRNYKKNLVNMGIKKENIFDVGSLGLDKIKLLNKYENSLFLKKYKINTLEKYFLITFHPTTLFAKKKIIEETKNLLLALKTFKEHKKIFTLPTADNGSHIISKMIKNFCKNNSASKFYTSLGSIDYLNMAQNSDLIIGNSSSGISEIPSIKKISINVGYRQKGRIFGNSVLNSSSKKNDIISNIKKGLMLSKNSNFIKKIKNPYGSGNSAIKSIRIIKKFI
jgi:GDP/UDP-N,N'-diacetylbacillosamine 2-epimerase (hydrolysing)